MKFLDPFFKQRHKEVEVTITTFDRNGDTIGIVEREDHMFSNLDDIIDFGAYYFADYLPRTILVEKSGKILFHGEINAKQK